MAGLIPGALGVAAFAGIKFAGYSVAAAGLKARERTVKGRIVTIAAARTGLGFLLGAPATLLGGLLIDSLLKNHYSPFADYATYGLLFVARIFIWMLLLFLFTRTAPLPKSRMWLYSLLGAVFSSFLDWPGYALAIAAPGKIPIC